MTETTERWLPVVGYEGHYEVSDLGRVRSLDRQKPYRNITKFTRGRVLAQHPNQDGYPTVRLSRDGAQRTVAVHRTMAESFLGARPEGAVVCHADDDRANNLLTNLRYGTRSDNQYDAVRNQRHSLASQTHCKRGHALRAPNLVRNHPTRMCLSCRIGRSKKTQRLEAKGIHIDRLALADDYYRQLMKE